MQRYNFFYKDCFQNLRLRIGHKIEKITNPTSKNSLNPSTDPPEHPPASSATPRPKTKAPRFNNVSPRAHNNSLISVNQCALESVWTCPSHSRSQYSQEEKRFKRIMHYILILMAICLFNYVYPLHINIFPSQNNLNFNTKGFYFVKFYEIRKQMITFA